MTAYLAAEQGYAICINYLHNQQAAQAIVSSIAKMGGRVIAFAADVALEEDVIKLFQMVDEQLGEVTALVNNAGILEHQMRLENMDIVSKCSAKLVIV
ncbi:SDR family NAD(P)-dependent oxidoreductase [Nostoc sp. CHAB 5834]|nr:SDR family NAD(P)-dependent oxidoreductase [Nostoc sp. CHAB 5834]